MEASVPPLLYMEFFKTNHHALYCTVVYRCRASSSSLRAGGICKLAVVGLVPNRYYAPCLINRASGFQSDAGPWTVLAADALVEDEGLYKPDFSAHAGSEHLRCIRISKATFDNSTSLPTNGDTAGPEDNCSRALLEQCNFSGESLTSIGKSSHSSMSSSSGRKHTKTSKGFIQRTPPNVGRGERAWARISHHSSEASPRNLGAVSDVGNASPETGADERTEEKTFSSVE